MSRFVPAGQSRREPGRDGTHPFRGVPVCPAPLAAPNSPHLPTVGEKENSRGLSRFLSRSATALFAYPPAALASLGADAARPMRRLAMTCLWCNRSFRPRRGGSPQRFSCAAHRAAFHSAARRWAERVVALGRLSIADLKADPAAHTLLPAPILPVPGDLERIAHGGPVEAPPRPAGAGRDDPRILGIRVCGPSGDDAADAARNVEIEPNRLICRCVGQRA
jgi:hypothetical protein